VGVLVNVADGGSGAAKCTRLFTKLLKNGACKVLFPDEVL